MKRYTQEVLTTMKTTKKSTLNILNDLNPSREGKVLSRGFLIKWRIGQ